ncbi:hypothetical protein KsCSTR_15970 [Candidatus Kuenenia stuttgartiensis]|uniref:Uncharacterized protein n=1 Tax=Kuenenia stuttgartiensis TaxID=174633 RepID=Q1Q1R1_KUEST|nr:hypothetical protein KsCSTR_15970 [Candidatus Kuenenia stuttgartiensis]CAJ73954.1 unknown protein [Candidatus Kuenenia stuttgartiensis]
MPLSRGEYLESPLERGKGRVLVIMNNFECYLHEFTHIQVKYQSTAFFSTKNREYTHCRLPGLCCIR